LWLPAASAAVRARAAGGEPTLRLHLPDGVSAADVARLFEAIAPVDPFAEGASRLIRKKKSRLFEAIDPVDPFAPEGNP
jgi:hypothetical protein